ncbi:MAG: hypothetical protein FWE39_07600 [Nocardiaceae bacterium]|nr:hypothetical protein [Nocardiaceae bacterium]
MANRSYLYTASFDAAERVSGISEWPYAIPLVYRILVSVDPSPCRSLIWTDHLDPIAVSGRCGPGIDRLERFLSRIEHPEIGPLADEAMTFLREHTEPDGRFVLECGEIFAMDDEPLGDQNARMVAALSDIDAEIDAAVARLAPTKPNFWQRVFKPAQESVEAPVRELGLGYWSDTLYFDLSDGR